jgi:hypothetical protein
MSGLVLKGALVEFLPTYLPVPVPNVIVFQYNPETMTHTWTQPQATPPPSQTAAGGTETSNPFAVKGPPGETFSFTIAMDANDEIADGSAPTAALAEASGIYSRLAALEMLLYPASAGQSGLVGAVSAGIASALSGQAPSATSAVPNSVIPVVLFIWGPGRIVPVRVTGLTITEKLYDAALNPTHAEAQLSLRVLTPDELQSAKTDNDVLAGLATVAYYYTFSLRQANAAANLANAAESIIGMIPH